MKNLEVLNEESQKRYAKNNDSNFDIIREYVGGEDPALLLDEVQKKLLSRWNYYINLKLGGELSSGEIVKKMMDHFNIERATVYKDMGNAEALFGYSSSINKRFRIATRIDFVEEKIKELYERFEIDAAVKLEAVLQKYYEAYPEIKQQRAPRVINFNITKNEYNVENLPSAEDALNTLEIFKTG